MYVNKAGKRINASSWMALSRDPEYCNIRLYENDKIKIVAHWHGLVDDRIAEMNWMWQPFALEVYNVLVDNDDHRTYVKDPTYTKTFHSEHELIHAYEEYLLLYTECSYEESGSEDDDGNAVLTFVERGNWHKPAIEIAPEAKEIIEHYKEKTDAGSW